MKTRRLLQPRSLVLPLLVIAGLVTSLFTAPQLTDAAATRKMVWVNRSSATIYRADLDGSNNENVTPSAGASDLIGVALDRVAGKMYYTSYSGSTIYRADLDGQNAVSATPPGLSGPMGIALDLVGGKMYYVTYWAPASVMRANLDGSSPETLATLTAGLVGISLDQGPANAYVTNWSTSRIHRVNLTTLAVTDITPAGTSGPQMIEVDGAGGKMYWANWNTSTIYRADLDGTNSELLASGNQPTGIALHVSQNKMYWTNQGNFTIYRANLDGTGVEDVTPAANVTSLYDIDLGFDQPTALHLRSFAAMTAPLFRTLAAIGVMGLGLVALTAGMAEQRRRFARTGWLRGRGPRPAKTQ